MRRCYWCGRFGGRLVRYQLHPNTPEYERNLCPDCERAATERRRDMSTPQA